MSKVRIVTHTSDFHMDDVFSVALVSILEEGNELEIIRSRDESVYPTADWLLDVGGKFEPQNKRFDHHQEDFAEKRSNGISCSTVGLLWREFGEKVTGGKLEAEIIDRKLIEFIDAVDCGTDFKSKDAPFNIYTLHDLIQRCLRPTGRELEKSTDQGLSFFLQAVDIARIVLKREIVQARDLIFDRVEVLKIYNQTEDKRVLVFPNKLSYGSIVSEIPEAIYIVGFNGPSDRWTINAIRKSENTYIVRKDLPSNWAGKTGEELQKITGVPDALFCHKELFIAGAKSLEGATKMAHLALQN
ncbi:MAG: MYG1 family protein [bacterium]